MRTWHRAHGALLCGGPCVGTIRKQDVYLVIENPAGRWVRCAKCAKKQYGDDPPAELPDDAVVVVPQPSLPLPIERRPDFVTPQRLAQSVRHDFKRRQTGERE